jgi:hypothetical protein
MRKTIGIVEVAALAASAAGSPPVVARNSYRSANKLRRQRRQSVVLAERPAVFDRDVLAFDETVSLPKTLSN